MQIISFVELPRRIFTRSDADLRGNILVARKLSAKALAAARKRDYPIYAELVRRVGYKLGKGFSTIPQRDKTTGAVLLDEDNKELIDSDFIGLQKRFASFRSKTTTNAKWTSWAGAHYSDIARHPALDMKPRRLAPRAVAHRKQVRAGNHVRLGDVADVVTQKIDLTKVPHAVSAWRLIEGSSIRAVEGTVVPSASQRAWEIVEAKQKNVFRATDNDIVVGLVRPERRNVGLLIDSEKDLVGAPDGVALVRVKPSNKHGITQEYLFHILRSETARVQLWTESGGTSYGKLTDDHIKDVAFPLPAAIDIKSVTAAVASWASSIRDASKMWLTIGSVNDRVPIINSPIFGLEPED